MENKKRILFVCLGNIVRSPLAENLFHKLAVDAGVGDRYAVDSAGTSAYHVGEAPDYRMRQVASHYGLDYTGSSRQFSRKDFDRFDLIIALDMSNRNSLLGLARTREDKDKIHLMRRFDPDSMGTESVPDPYYGGLDGFQETYKIIERSCQGLLNALENGELD